MVGRDWTDGEGGESKKSPRPYLGKGREDGPARAGKGPSVCVRE